MALTKSVDSPSSPDRINIFLHPVCAVFPHFFCHMAVHIQGECHSGMTEIFGNSFNIISVFQADRRERMPEIMEPDIRQADCCDPGLEGMVHRTGADMVSQLVCENKIIFIPEAVPAL